jgi:hypothetical protein
MEQVTINITETVEQVSILVNEDTDDIQITVNEAEEAVVINIEEWYGSDGKSILSGNVTPSAETGNNGDFYIDLSGVFLYGPKSAGAWGDYISLKGNPGVPGDPGAAGNRILSGNGSPSSGTGNNGDFYIDLTAVSLYGPKTAGSWAGSISLKGLPGSPGIGITPGGSVNQMLVKNSSSDYDTKWQDQPATVSQAMALAFAIAL